MHLGAKVLISDQLRSMREACALFNAFLRRACAAAMSLGLRTAIRFQTVETIEKFARALEVPIYHVRERNPDWYTVRTMAVGEVANDGTGEFECNDAG